MKKVSVFWFRRDLRVEDNHGLFQALSGPYPVLPIFIFDKAILSRLPSKKDGRVEFIHDALADLKSSIVQQSGDISIFHDHPLHVFEKLTNEYDVQAIYLNHDHEKYAIQRDEEIKHFAKSKKIGFHTYKDHVIFEKDEVLSGKGTPYTVFTPYANKWKERLRQEPLPFYPSQKLPNYINIKADFPSLELIGFAPSELPFPEKIVTDQLIKDYQASRDFPAIKGTSKLSVHLRFGTISIRSLVTQANGTSETWLNELIWRDFYFNILYHFPHISNGLAFRKEYDNIQWRNNEVEFEAWKQGKTGYPMVDAGMRELNQTGFMHNRVRMVVASFLVKHLLIDWRWGETYFAEKLLDYDFSANNGGWQWAAGSGCDAAPYFRVFNPSLQAQKFDPKFIYIKKWVPEFQELTYTNPIVNHEFARKRVLEVYKEALGK
jgi:deoxyribodipyrimidine photo-lyase